MPKIPEPSFEDSVAARLGGETLRAWKAGELSRDDLLAAVLSPSERREMRVRRVVEFSGPPDLVVDQLRRSLAEGEHRFPIGKVGAVGGRHVRVAVAQLGLPEMTDGSAPPTRLPEDPTLPRSVAWLRNELAEYYFDSPIVAYIGRRTYTIQSSKVEGDNDPKVVLTLVPI